MIIRTSSRQGAGKLIRVTLAQIDPRYRAQVSRRMREQQWEHELRPDTGYSPDMRTRVAALLDAVLIEKAAREPSMRGYYVPEDAAAYELEKHGAVGRVTRYNDL